MTPLGFERAGLTYLAINLVYLKQSLELGLYLLFLHAYIDGR